MGRWKWFGLIAAAAAATALLARPHSPGIRYSETALAWAVSLEEGRAAEALAMMEPGTAEGYSEEFLSRLAGEEAPESFHYDGFDSGGVRMSGVSGDRGSRIVWLTDDDTPGVIRDTALDNLLGQAVFICRENALAHPEGRCPVSGASYTYDREAGLVVCPEGHLGEGLFVNSLSCAARRDSVVIEVEAFMAAGYPAPASLEDMYTESSGEFGRRGGYRCPDNGYAYYSIRDGAVYCPFHEETTQVRAVVEE